MRRWTAAICAAGAVYAGLMCVAGATVTRPVVVAATAMRRGDAVNGDMFRVVEVPADAALDTALSSMEDVADDGIAQVDIAEGQPIFDAMIRGSPVTPDGFTVIEVRLASAVDALMVGDTVSLSSAMGCAAGDDAHDDAHDDAEISCLLAERALVMSRFKELTALAMPPEDALRVMTSQEAGAIVAVAKQSS
ncbi:flagellar basal body P-ring biosynthesis protein FlgA [Bifidobacterium ramosum]|nr:SAF domain-containing protein [Bifidobacterium ramosum]KAB8286734.1 flagellar basal body P-ring biosynthesis protein FlgA [Bifidobacterium ramosum]